MELLCPSCQQRLTVPDQFAGQLMKCPMCANNFTAPALQTMTAAPTSPSGPQPPAPPPPPPAPPPAMPAAPPPMAPASPMQFFEGTTPLSAAAEAPATSSAPAPQPFAAEPLPAAESARTCTIWISPRVVPWITPIGLALVLFVSLFTWISVIDYSAWGLGFSTGYSVFYSIFLVLLILGLLASIPSLLLTLKVIPAPPALAPFEPWRPVVVGGIVFLAFLCFFVKYLEAVFHAYPMTIWMRLAFCTHFVVVISCFLEFWLTLRGPTKPMPRIEMHW